MSGPHDHSVSETVKPLYARGFHDITLVLPELNHGQAVPYDLQPFAAHTLPFGFYGAMPPDQTRVEYEHRQALRSYKKVQPSGARLAL